MKKKLKSAIKIFSDNTFRGFFRSSVISILASIFIGIASYFIRRILSASLTVTDYATFYAIIAFMSLLVTLFRFGSADMLLFVIPRLEKLGKNTTISRLFTTVCRINFTIFLLLSIVLALSGKWLTQTYFPSIPPWTFYLTLPFLLLSAFEGITINTFNALKSFMTLYGLRALKTVLMFLGVLLLASLGINGAILAFNIPLVIIIILAFLLLRKKISFSLRDKCNLSLLGRYKHRCLWLFFLSFGGMIFNELGTVVLTLTNSAAEVAYFNIAIPIAMLFRSLYCVALVFIPFIEDLQHSGDFRQLNRYIHFFLLCITIIAVAMVPIYGVFGEKIVIFFFDEKYVPAVSSSFILSEAMLIALFAQFNINTLNAMNQEKTAAIITFIVAVIAVISYIPLSYYGGATGTAYGSMFAALLWSIVSYLYLKKYLRRAVSTQSKQEKTDTCTNFKVR